MEADDVFTDEDFVEAQKPSEPLEGRFVATIEEAGDDQAHTAVAGQNSLYLPLKVTISDGNGGTRTSYPKVTVATNKQEEKARKGVKLFLAKFFSSLNIDPATTTEVVRGLRAREEGAASVLVGRSGPVMCKKGVSKKGRPITEVDAWLKD